MLWAPAGVSKRRDTFTDALQQKQRLDCRLRLDYRASKTANRLRNQPVYVFSVYNADHVLDRGRGRGMCATPGWSDVTEHIQRLTHSQSLYVTVPENAAYSRPRYAEKHMDIGDRKRPPSHNARFGQAAI